MQRPTEELADITVAFLEVAFHTILRARSVYPATSFERRKAFGVPAFMARHPAVCDGIAECLHALRPQLVAGTVDCVALVLLDSRGVAVGQYLFDVLSSEQSSSPASYSDLDTMLASALTRLGTMKSDVPHAKDGSWTIMVRSHDVLAGPQLEAAGAGASSSKNTAQSSVAAGLGFPATAAKASILGPNTSWVRADAPHDGTARLLGQAAGPSAPAAFVPVKSVRAGPLHLEVRYEEGQ